MAKTRGGHTTQLRRSSRIKNLSRPKNTTVETVDLVDTSDQESAMEGSDNSNSSQRVFRRANNKYKITAGRSTVESDEDAVEQNLMEDELEDELEEDTEVELEEEREERKTDEKDDSLDENMMQDEFEDEQHEEPSQHDEPQQKIKVTKWKRKAVQQDENMDEAGKRKRPNVKFSTKILAKLDDMEIHGTAHINKKKNEIKIRNSPRLFSEMLYYLSAEQRQWVIDSGFEGVVDFCLEMLPGKLAYNIFQIFDKNSVSLKLKDESIKITEEDVYDVLGLPYGGETVTLGSGDCYQQRTNEWLAQFPTEKEREQITTAKLIQIMKGQGLTQNFKFNFLIVLSNVLVGTSTNSYVDRQLLRLPGNVDHWYKYNWAEYLLNYLVAATDSWNKTASVFFRGSLVFLTLFYVDRVRHMGIKLVERRFPCYKGWTEDILRNREKLELADGMFGVGSVEVPLRVFISQNNKPSTKQNATDHNCQQEDANGNEFDWNDGQGWDDWENIQHQSDEKTWEKADQEVPIVFEGHAKQNTEDGETTKKQVESEKTTKDLAEQLRLRAMDLIEEKLLIETDLKIALEKDPDNQELLLVFDVIHDIFHPIKEDNDNVNKNHKSAEQDRNGDDDFQLRTEDIEEIDLVDYVITTKQMRDEITTKDKHDDYPYFSLGIEDDINDKQCEEINEDDETNQNGAAIDEDDFITPKPAIREKSTRLVKLTRYGKSPYIDRVIDISGKFTNLDFGLWKFLNKQEEPLGELFIWNGFSCLTENMQTLKMNTKLSYSVVDTWSVILNDSEKYKADESPMRLFCTIGCVHPSLDEKKSVNLTYPIFAENMDEILRRFNREKLESMDMVFFPIYAYEHFYLICYNLRNPTYELIDNVKRNEDPKIYYGAKPTMLHSHFTKYLKAKGHLNLAKSIRKLKPNYMKMHWQTTNNSDDCGIFLMRHMETYKGDSRSWDTRFKEETHAQLVKLRVKYNNAILSSKINEKREAIIKEGIHLYNEAAANRVINVLIESSQGDTKRVDDNQSGKKKTVTFAKNLTSTFEEGNPMKEKQ